MTAKYRERSGFVVDSATAQYRFLGSMSRLHSFLVQKPLPKLNIARLSEQNVEAVAHLHQEIGGHFLYFTECVCCCNVFTLAIFLRLQNLYVGEDPTF